MKSLNTTANKLTMLRILMIPIFMVLLYVGKCTAALVVYIIACLTDALDGYIARHYDQVTDFGKLVDPLADKVLVMAALCIYVETGKMPGWALAVVILREFAVSGLRMIALEKGKVIAAARSGKIKTGVTMVSICIMMISDKFFPDKGNLCDIICVILILIVTVISGIDYFYTNRKLFN